MDQKRWMQIEEALQQALDLPPEQRATFLEQFCAGDPALQERVKALLDRERDADSFMETPAMAGFIDGSPLEPGAQIGRYRIESHIGAGGMGEVYKARDETLDRVVALKMLPLEFTSDPERVRRFRQEALAASRLNHPNIITIFEIVQQDSNHFIVEEYVEGQTLRELLTDAGTKEQRRLPLEKALDVTTQIARALKAAHTAWIIHRDIKPENIMIREDGLVKVVDFGIAKLGDEYGPTSAPVASPSVNDPTLTLPGAVMGTASYMSPEQARGEQLDGRTDLFSLGILLHEMITGSRLFAGSTRIEAIERLQQPDDVVRRGLKSSYVPKELERVLRRVLQSNRDERYASAAELLDDLYAFKRRLESRTTRRIVGASLLAVAVAIAIVGVAAFLSVNETWEEKIFQDGHTAAVRCAVFSPDGQLLVSVSEDQQVIVWDFERRMRRKTLTDHKGIITTVSFSPDGKWFLTGDEEKTAILWSASRFEPEAIWRDEVGPVKASAFSPDRRYVIYGGPDGSIVREIGTWTKVSQLGSEFFYGTFLFPTDRLVRYSAGRVWDLQTGELLTSTDSGANWEVLSPDRKRMASVDAFGYVTFSDVERSRVVRKVHGHHDHGRGAAYSPDGKLVATGAERVVLWDPLSTTMIVPLEYESIVWSVAFSPDGRWLVSTHGDGSILIWDVANRELEANLRQHSGAVRGLAVAQDGKRLATASEDHSVIVWDLDSGRKETVFTRHKTRVAAVAFSSDGSWLASGDQSGKLVSHDLASKDVRLEVVPRPLYSSYCVAISPDGRFLATSSEVYNAETGEVVVPYGVDWKGVYSAAFSADGRILIGAIDQGVIVIMETATWRVIASQQWTDSGSGLVSLSISPDGNHFVTGEDAKKIRLGTINPLREVALLGEHSARVKAVTFSPDGNYVASAGDDKMVALWDVKRRKLVTTIGTHTSPIYALGFSPDGTRLITGEHDRSVRQYTRRRTLWGFSLN